MAAAPILESRWRPAARRGESRPPPARRCRHGPDTERGTQPARRDLPDTRRDQGRCAATVHLTRISHHGHGLRDAVRPRELGKARKRVARPRARERTMWASTVVPATLFDPLLADRTPGRIVRSARVPRDAGRDRGEKCGLVVCRRKEILGAIRLAKELPVLGPAISPLSRRSTFEFPIIANARLSRQLKQQFPARTDPMLRAQVWLTVEGVFAGGQDVSSRVAEMRGPARPGWPDARGGCSQRSDT